MSVSIEASWRKALAKTFTQPYFTTLRESVRNAYQQQTVYPSPQQVFRAFDLCPLDTVRVVILGQDPYHGPGQAHGLAFSVPDTCAIPPSLRNIYQEIAYDTGCAIPTTGNLEHWATQGVLLLNTTLTVPAGTPGGHQGLGWERFTDTVIEQVSDKRPAVAFLLWGKHAISKTTLIDQEKHCVLTAPHPSPLSAYRGFFGCRHFSQANAFLQKTGQPPIDW